MLRKLIVPFFLTGFIFIVLGLSNRGPVASFPPASTPSATPRSNSVRAVGILSARATPQDAVITKVIDGDTAETSTGEKIRYLGINSPEKGEPFSNEATKENSELVLDKKVRLEYDVQTKDRYGRTLAYLFINEQMVNVQLVSLGLAVSETIQPNVKYQDKILAAEKSARKNCLGIWNDLCSPSLGQGFGGQANSNCIKIITINYDAPGNDNQNKNGEWIEIGNSCPDSVQMQGWMIKDSSASNRYKFKNFSLGSSSSMLIHSGCGTDSQTDLYWQCPEGKYAIWNNAGDHAFLYNQAGELISDYEY